MTLDEIQSMWKKDSEMDQDLLCEESLRVPQLHMKYHELFNTFYMMKKENEYKLKSLIRDKWKYYKGKAPKEIKKKMTNETATQNVASIAIIFISISF